MKFLVQQQPAFVCTGFPGASRRFDPQLPSVVFIHGAANDHSVWAEPLREIADELPKTGVNLLAVDLPGHGQTFGDPKPTVEAYADWVINLLDNGGIEAATLIGHSMGSLIALDCARRYPSRVNKLGLIGTAVPMLVSEVLLQTVRDTPEMAYEQLTRYSFHLVKLADGSFPPPTHAMNAYRALLGTARAGVAAKDLTACANYRLLDADIAAVNTPTHILASRHDKMTAADAASALAAQLPHAQLTMIENTGHAMMQDAPDQVATWLARCLAH